MISIWLIFYSYFELIIAVCLGKEEKNNKEIGFVTKIARNDY